MTRLESIRYHMMQRIKMPFLRPIFRELLVHNASGVSQAGLRLLYAQQESSDPIGRFGFRCFSEHDEDGILLFLVSKLGAWNGCSVEIGCGDARQCNTTNLILNHGFQGLMVDADKQNARGAHAFFAEHPETLLCRPAVSCACVTPENVNAVVRDAIGDLQVDVLSIDTDGADLWIWDAFSVAAPSIVVVEFNAIWGPGESLSVPPAARAPVFEPGIGMAYGGASLEAYRRVAARKGYRLLGVNRVETNAFFVRQDLCGDWGKEVSVAACLVHPRTRKIQEAFRSRLANNVAFGEWMEVE